MFAQGHWEAAIQKNIMASWRSTWPYSLVTEGEAALGFS